MLSNGPEPIGWRETREPGDIGFDLLAFFRIDGVDEGHRFFPQLKAERDAQTAAEFNELADATASPLQAGNQLLANSQSLGDLLLGLAAGTTRVPENSLGCFFHILWHYTIYK